MAFRWIIHGRVQGVGFRWFTESMAKMYRLNGFVRNLPDGTVEVWAEGEEEKIRKFKAALIRGNGFSRVDNIEEEIVPDRGFHGFTIKF